MTAVNKNEYVVKYLGIVEGNVGCLSRKMNMPSKAAEHVNLSFRNTKHKTLHTESLNLKDFELQQRSIRAPILRNKYDSFRQNRKQKVDAFTRTETLNHEFDQSKGNVVHKFVTGPIDVSAKTQI